MLRLITLEMLMEDCKPVPKYKAFVDGKGDIKARKNPDAGKVKPFRYPEELPPVDIRLPNSVLREMQAPYPPQPSF